MFLPSLATQIFFMLIPTPALSNSAAVTSPHVAIAGAGPAGLLSAILLSQAGVSVTVLEKSPVADPWSTKSYSINLNSRGLEALDYAGVLEDVQAAGMMRRQVVLESSDGEQQKIPKSPPHYAVTRPALVECLEQIVQRKHADRVTIQRGVEVKQIDRFGESGGGSAGEDNETNRGQQLLLTLDNGSSISCTHVIGADGKWSAVRESLPDWKDQFQVQPEPAFGISITPSVIPKRWHQDATTVFRPKNPKYYVLAAPLPDGRFSVSAVCFDEIQEDHPWMVPRDGQQTLDWGAEYGATSGSNNDEAFLSDKISELFQHDLPIFFEDICGKESMSTARINRRTSWLKPLSDDPQYCDRTGRVALIGDAAHAMTPSIGEGCNCALESAVCLIQCLSPYSPMAHQKGEEKHHQQQQVTVERLTKAFRDYGMQRPPQMLPIQLKSASSNRYKVPETSPR